MKYSYNINLIINGKRGYHNYNIIECKFFWEPGKVVHLRKASVITVMVLDLDSLSDCSEARFTYSLTARLLV